jgi:beta-glucosidase
MTYRLSRHAFALVAVIAVAATVVVASPGARAQTAPYLDPGQPISVRVDDLLSRMTLDEKIGQMTQVDIAAIDNPSDLASYRIGSVLAGGG